MTEHEQLIERMLQIAHQRETISALEARVAELEGALRVVSDRAVSEALLRQDALDQARGLLERFVYWFPQAVCANDARDWLRTHPAPDTPAEPVRVYGGEGMPDVVLESEPATPAATGADSFTTRHGDVIDLGEKERAP